MLPGRARTALVFHSGATGGGADRFTRRPTPSAYLGPIASALFLIAVAEGRPGLRRRWTRSNGPAENRSPT